MTIVRSETEPPLLATRSEAANRVYASQRRIYRRTLEVTARKRAAALTAAGDLIGAVGVLEACAAKIRAIGEEPPYAAPSLQTGSRWTAPVPDGVRWAQAEAIV